MQHIAKNNKLVSTLGAFRLYSEAEKQANTKPDDNFLSIAHKVNSPAS
jgi:hypothetical protein